MVGQRAWLFTVLLPVGVAQASDADKSAADDLQMPELLEAVEPPYPPEAKAARVVGTVHLQMLVDELGEVTEVQLVSGPGSALNEAALVAATQYRFRAARYKGQPVAVRIDFRMHFSLEERAPTTLAALQGQVVDARGKAVVGAEIELLEAGGTAASDNEGRFLFSPLSPGIYTAQVSAPGFAPRERTIEVTARHLTEARIVLAARRENVYETLVVGRRLRDEVRRLPLQVDPAPVVSHFELTRRDIELTPGSLEDVSRAIQSIPGVVGDPGLLATFFVRGGDSDEVIFYLDGIPIANPFHLGGFVTLFNPELITAIDFFAGGQSAKHRNSLSGILDVTYDEGDPEIYEGLVDVSMNTAKASVAGPTPLSGLSFMVAARRSYFEAYFAMMRRIGLVGSDFAAPDFGEYLVKGTYQSGAHRGQMLFVQSADGLSFASHPADDTIIAFDGSIELNNRLTLGGLSWSYQPGAALAARAGVSYLLDTNKMIRRGAAAKGDTGALMSSGDLRVEEMVGTLDLTWNAFGTNHLRWGVDTGWRRQSFIGRVSDTRLLPDWAGLALANYQLPTLDIAPKFQRTEVGVYVEDEWVGLAERLTPRLGVRVDWASLGETLVSPRAGLSVRAWPGAVVKGAWGIYYQRTLDPLSLDAVYGNPSLLAERVHQYIAGVEQLLPIAALLRLEGYYKDMESLIVTPDTQAKIDAGTTFTNDGRGRAYGLDMLLLGRLDMFGWGIGYAYQHTERQNPLHDVFVRRYQPLQAQQHTVGLSADARYGESWVFSGRYVFFTGRPYTAHDDFHLQSRDAEQVWVPDFGAAGGPGGRRWLNSRRRRNFHEVSTRVEYWLRYPSLRAMLYLEVLNVTNQMRTFVHTYDEGDPAAGIKPEQGAFKTFPIRPFLGVRVEL